MMGERRGQMRLCHVSRAGAVTLLMARLVCGQTYTVTDLGALPGYDHSHARAVNSDGYVVGYSTNDLTQRPERATLWPPSAETTDLGTLGGDGGSATSLNDDGLVVGVSDVQPGLSSPSHAYVWESPPMEDLGTLGGATSWADGVSGSAQIVGGSRIVGDEFSHPCLWEVDGSIHDLGVLPLPNHCCGGARAINASGQIVGYSTSVFAQTHATLWTWAKGDVQDLQDLGTLPGGCCSDAFDINDAGKVVGSSRLDGATRFHGFLWEGDGQRGTMIDLGVLSGGRNSVAHAVNSFGLVVGMSWTNAQSPGDPHGVVWQDQKICDLNDLILETAGWTVIEARDINDAGQIVGVGVNQDTGVTHGLLLAPVVGSPGDFNGDGDVDLDDYAYLWSVRTGPLANSDPRPIDNGPCIQSRDLDDDGDVDLQDFAAFARSFTGPR